MLTQLESFSIYDQTHILDRWTEVHNAGHINISTSYGRNGAGLSLRTGSANASGNGILFQRRWGDGNFASDSWAVGFAFKLVDVALTANIPIVSFTDSRTVLGFIGNYDATQISLNLAGNQRFRVMRGERDSGTSLGDVPVAIKRNTFYFVEIAVVIHDTTGSVTVKIDGVSVLALTNVDTQATSYATADGVRFGHHKTSTSSNIARTFYLDDIYIKNDGTAFSDVIVEAIRPTADGNSTEWTPSAGAVNADLVDDTVPDRNTTYVKATLAGKKDTYVHSNPATSAGVVHGLTVNTFGLTDEPTPGGTIVPIIRHSGADYEGSRHGLGTVLDVRTYRYEIEGYLTNPGTGSAFSLAEVAACEYGFKLLPW